MANEVKSFHSGLELRFSS